MNAAGQSLTTPDGARIHVRMWEPVQADRGTVVVGGAMGARQDFYAPFAQWLAARGWRVATFDYRGHGFSRPEGAMREVRADLMDWVRDLDAVIAFAHARTPDRPLFLLGHSLGAQLPGLLQQRGDVAGMLSVAAGSGYWRQIARRRRLATLFLWWVLVPLATPLFGYFPGRLLRAVGDIPAGVMRQWRRWCLSREYSVGAEGDGARASYAAVRYPIVALSVTDDELMTHEGTRSLLDLYTSAPRVLRRISPGQVSQRRIGHFGPFRRSQESALWPVMEEELHALRLRACKPTMRMV
jgi:predicted alpha/beta hydrolase